MRFDLGTLDSGERSLPFGLLVITKHFKGHEIYNNTCTSCHKMQADCEGPVFDVIFVHLFGCHFEGLFCDTHHDVL